MKLHMPHSPITHHPEGNYLCGQANHAMIVSIFLITAAISFMGSLQPGPVNMMVLRTAVSADMKAALWVSAGGALPEILYAGMALTFVSYLHAQPEILNYFEKAVLPVLVILGLCFIFKKRKPVVLAIRSRGTYSFSKGLVLGLLNPQLLPFWFGILVYVNSMMAMDDPASKVAFATGAAAGAFALLAGYAAMARRNRALLQRLADKLPFDRLLGWTFILMAAVKYMIS